jgi:type II secretory pathway pseudopilin PulG
MTLVEVMVSTALLSVVMTLFTAGMTVMFHTAGTIEALDVVQSNFRIATQRLDKQIRFATAVGTPSQVSGDSGNWHVVFAAAGVCVELRLDAAGQTLGRRTPASSSAWSTLASAVTVDGTNQPFARDSGASSGRQRLILDVVLTAGGARDLTQRVRNVEFTALTSSVSP